MTVGDYEITARVMRIGGIILAIIAAVLFLSWGPRACMAGKKKEAEVATGQAGAGVAAGEEAGNTIGNVLEGRRQTDEAVKAGQDEVRAAPEGEKGAAAVNAACRFRANADKPECRKVPR
jgi:hypothetical protein